MDNFIKSIFIEAGFECSERINFKGDFSANFSFFTRTVSNKFDFYLVGNFREKEVSLEYLQQELAQCLDSILLEMNVSGLDKNLSFLLLLETESTMYSKKRTKYIYNIEEDPYDFKKYVLTHTKGQFDALEIQLNEMQAGPLLYKLNYLLLEKKLFASFKKKEEVRNTIENKEADIYDLVSKLFIKLPFLSVTIEQENLGSLKKEIDAKLTQTQSNIVNLMLEQYIKDPELQINDILTVIGCEDIE